MTSFLYRGILLLIILFLASGTIHLLYQGLLGSAVVGGLLITYLVNQMVRS